MSFSDGAVRAKVWESGTSEPNEWELSRDVPSFKSKFTISTDTGDSGTSHNRQIILEEIDAGGHAISGQVIDQNGEPVPNATVGALGADYGAVNESLDDLNATAEDIEAEADRLMREARNVEVPDEWQEFSDKFGSDGMLEIGEFRSDIDGTYPLVHQQNDWGSGETNVFKSEVDDPRIQVASDQRVVISLWNPETGNIIWPEGPVDNSFPGKTVEGEVTLEQYGPGQGIVDKRKISTDSDAFVVSREIGGDQEYPAIKTHLSTGIYRVYPSGSPEKAYTFSVGDAEEQWTALETEMRNEADSLEEEAGQLTNHAQRIQQNIESGLFERTTTTTDENGKFTLRMQTGVQKATIQAYRADGTVLPKITGPSFQDLRNLADGDYNGTYHVGAPLTYDVPKENVTLETYRTDQLPYQGIDSLNEFKNWVRDQQLNETIDDIQSEYDKRFEEMNRTQLEARYSVHRPLVETIPGAEDRYLEKSEFDEIQDIDGLSDDELATEVGHMETVLTGMDQIEAPDFEGENPIDISDGVLNAEYGPIPSGIDTDTLQPEIHWSNGESVEIPDEYWSVESRGTFGTTNYLVVDGYPIGDTDPAALDLRILGGGAGGMLDDRLSALNPSFAGSIPDVRAIDVSTLSPGQSESVSLTMRTGDNSNYGGLESVEVFGPDGQELSASTDGDSASFSANGAGEHFVRATVTDTTGGQFVHTFSVRALEQGRQNPPTVRAETATGDRVFAIAGDGLDDAEIRADGGTLEVDAIAPGGEISSSVHIKPQAAMDTAATSIDVRVLEGSQEATVDTTVETVIHLDSLAEDAIVWRGEPSIWGEPIADGGTRYGEVMERDVGNGDTKYIIRTYSKDDGSVSLTINEDPSWFWDSPQHTAAQWIPSFNLPVLSVLSSLLGSLLIGGVGLFTRRRYPSR